MFDKIKSFFAKQEGLTIFILISLLIVFVSSQVGQSDRLQLESTINTDSFITDANYIINLLTTLESVNLNEDLLLELNKYSNYYSFGVQVDLQTPTGVSNPFGN